MENLFEGETDICLTEYSIDKDQDFWNDVT